ncbi:MAG: hypothetical protein AAFY71_27290 [Bacteroidota bacterium]
MTGISTCIKKLGVLLGLIAIMLPLSAQQEDCRLKVADLKPVIKRLNPFFANHTWDRSGQIEMAKMGENRLIMITQDGCKRHHTRFSLIIEPNSTQKDMAFWITESESFLHKVYWKNQDYDRFGRAFNKTFAEKLNMYGFGQQFNFPLGTRNFICQVDNHPERGGRITIEMVTFIFKEKVQSQKQGIPVKEDDGWRQ